ncbi:TM0106 family RecB-like putative nuclease [Geminocystis herdmanii]|uniref:TM0106 family RecB-like putative nuclease n=1 Tax=Geminocystis herdmanii TaxID=669359 RepID=UPI00034855B9|nr:TM0106 family RecB-like putative nuclease [Geminocystis herdmanii]
MLVTDELLFQYKRCHRRAFLNIYEENNQKQEEKDFIVKLRQERESHSWQVLQTYNLPYHQPKLLVEDSENNFQVASMTENLMRQGVDCIYQGVVIYTHYGENQEKIVFETSPSLLIKQNIPSLLGDWSYIPVNTHLGKSMKPEYKLISAFQGEVLSLFQGVNLSESQIFLRCIDKPYYLNLKIWIPHCRELIREFIFMVSGKNEPDVFISRQRCSFCQWFESCHSLAKSQQHLSLIPGITPKKYDSLMAEGINNLASLCEADLSELIRLFGNEIGNNIHQQALSLYHSQAIFRHPIITSIPTNSIELYFDIEAQNFDYLLGVLLVNNETKEKKYYTFLAENIEQEKEIWLSFLELVNQYPDAPIFHYSEYERETVKRLAYVYQTSSADVQPLLKRLFDLHKFVTNSFFLPVENYSLKSVANWLGFRWRDPVTGNLTSGYHTIGGDQCVFWYDQWLKTFDRETALRDRTWLNYILIYNEDDCLGTYQLKKWLSTQI